MYRKKHGYLDRYLLGQLYLRWRKYGVHVTNDFFKMIKTGCLKLWSLFLQKELLLGDKYVIKVWASSGQNAIFIEVVIKPKRKLLCFIDP